MYKVFLNERKITITSPGEITQNIPTEKFTLEARAEDVKSWFQEFLENGLDQTILTHPEPENFFKTFSKSFKRISAAGGVVKSNKKILFIFRNGKWDLPKGKAEKNEKPEKTALREVEEECGIEGHTIVKQLPGTYHLYEAPQKKKKFKWILKKTNWFEMNYSGNDAGKPQTEEGITKIRWFAKKELDEVWANTYENLKLIIGLYRD